jgi:hypothetical protein
VNEACSTETPFGRYITSEGWFILNLGDALAVRNEEKGVALSVFFDDTEEQEWFAPHLVEFVDHGGGQTMSLEGGPSFERDSDGTWQEVGGSTEVGDVLNPSGGIPRELPDDAKDRIRRWLRRRA